MMGPSHAMSGAAAWLAGVGIYATVTHQPITPAALLLGTAVCAGAALAPDLDNASSTVVSAFGFAGKGFGKLVDALSVFVYNLTKTRREEPKDYGHRTLFHTAFMAIVAGLITAFLSASTKRVDVLGQHLTLGQVSALVIMALFLHLGLSGLFAKQEKKARAKYGPTLTLVVSIIITLVTAFFLPETTGHVHTYSYWWLGLAVGGGWFIHLLGDAITKQGVPLIWPIHWHRKAWYDVALPSILRIKAGGTVEVVFLLPLFIVATVGFAIYDVLKYSGAIH